MKPITHCIFRELLFRDILECNLKLAVICHHTRILSSLVAMLNLFNILGNISPCSLTCPLNFKETVYVVV